MDFELEKDTFKPKDGVYVTGSWINNTIGGDFDDSLLYTDGTTIYNVPDVDGGNGFGVTLGATWPAASVEIGYQRTMHDTDTILPGVGEQDAAFNAIDLNVKIHVIRESRFRPYVLLGFGIPWITIDNNMVNSDGSLDDETFTGISGNVGGGLAFYLTEQIFINGQAMYRWSSFGSIEGNSLDDNVGASGPSFSLGLGYTF